MEREKPQAALDSEYTRIESISARVRPMRSATTPKSRPPMAEAMSVSEFRLLVLGPLVAFFGTGYFSGFAAIASEIFPGEIRAAAMGLSYNVGRGLSAVAPLAVGALALHYGIGPAFFLQAGAFFLAAMLALALPETRGRQLT